MADPRSIARRGAVHVGRHVRRGEGGQLVSVEQYDQTRRLVRELLAQKQAPGRQPGPTTNLVQKMREAPPAPPKRQQPTDQARTAMRKELEADARRYRSRVQGAPAAKDTELRQSRDAERARETAGEVARRVREGTAWLRTEPRGDGDDLGLGIVGVRPVARHTMAPDLQDALIAIGASPVDMYELPDTPEGARAYYDAVGRAKNTKFGAAVSQYDLDEYASGHYRLFLTKEGHAGIAVSDDGQGVCAFNSRPDLLPGVVATLMPIALEHGAYRADCFDTVLPNLYAPYGFVTRSRTEFDDDYAPEGWDYELYGRWNGGRPDVVFMQRMDGAEGRQYQPGEGEYVESYDDGMASTLEVPETPEVPQAAEEGNIPEEAQAEGLEEGLEEGRFQGAPERPADGMLRRIWDFADNPPWNRSGRNPPSPDLPVVWTDGMGDPNDEDLRSIFDALGNPTWDADVYDENGEAVSVEVGFVPTAVKVIGPGTLSVETSIQGEDGKEYGRATHVYTQMPDGTLERADMSFNDIGSEGDLADIAVFEDEVFRSDFGRNDPVERYSREMNARASFTDHRAAGYDVSRSDWRPETTLEDIGDILDRARQLVSRMPVRDEDKQEVLGRIALLERLVAGADPEDRDSWAVTPNDVGTLGRQQQGLSIADGARDQAWPGLQAMLEARKHRMVGGIRDMQANYVPPEEPEEEDESFDTVERGLATGTYSPPTLDLDALISDGDYKSYDLSDPEIQPVLDAYEMELGTMADPDLPGETTTVHSKVTKVSADYGTLIVNGEFVLEDGTKVGTFTRHITYGEEGYLEASHEYAAWETNLQGQGHMSRFNQNLDDLYEQNGVEEIRLHANITVGGYAWATAGYDWDPRQSSMDTVRHILASIERQIMGEQDDAIRAEALADVRAIREALDAADEYDPDTWPTPAELAGIGRKAYAAKHARIMDEWALKALEAEQNGEDVPDKPQLTWPGKQGMIGMHWYGVRRPGTNRPRTDATERLRADVEERRAEREAEEAEYEAESRRSVEEKQAQDDARAADQGLGPIERIHEELFPNNSRSLPQSWNWATGASMEDGSVARELVDAARLGPFTVDVTKRDGPGGTVEVSFQPDRITTFDDRIEIEGPLATDRGAEFGRLVLTYEQQPDGTLKRLDALPDRQGRTGSLDDTEAFDEALDQELTAHDPVEKYSQDLAQRVADRGGHRQVPEPEWETPTAHPEGPNEPLDQAGLERLRELVASPGTFQGAPEVGPYTDPESGASYERVVAPKVVPPVPHDSFQGAPPALTGEAEKAIVPHGFPRSERNERTGTGNDATSMDNLSPAVKAKVLAKLGAYYDMTPEQLEANILALYQRTAQEHRDAGEVWYPKARALTYELSEKYGVEPHVVAGIIAATSPQHFWGSNIAAAEYWVKMLAEDAPLDADVLTLLGSTDKTKRQPTRTKSLLTWARSEVAGVKSKPRPVWPTDLEGKRLSELDPSVAAALLKAMSQAGHKTEGIGDHKAGEPLRYWNSEKGRNSGVQFSCGTEGGAQAVRMFRTGDPEVLGGHKVRSFYNGVLYAEDRGDDVVVDTHALGAALGVQLDGDEKKWVMDGFDYPESNADGLKGMYPAFADAYRSAAAKLGIPPQALQAMVWLQWRQERLDGVPANEGLAAVYRDRYAAKQKVKAEAAESAEAVKVADVAPPALEGAAFQGAPSFQGAPRGKSPTEKWEDKPRPEGPPVERPTNGEEYVTLPNGKTYPMHSSQSESTYPGEPPRVMVVPDEAMLDEIREAGVAIPKRPNLRVNANWNQPGARLVANGDAPDGTVASTMNPWHQAAQLADKHDRGARIEPKVTGPLEKAMRELAETNPTAALALLLRLTGSRVGTGAGGQSLVPNPETGVREPRRTIGMSHITPDHLTFEDDGSITIRFLGKHGKENTYNVSDPGMVAVLTAAAEGKAPDEQLFPTVTADHTTRFLRDHTGEDDIKNHDLRTLYATERARAKIAEMGLDPQTEAELNKAMKEVAAHVGGLINDTPKVAIDTYINPSVFNQWNDKVRAAEAERIRAAGGPETPEEAISFQGAPAAIDLWNEKPPPAHPPVEHPGPGATHVTTPDGRTYEIHPTQSESSYDDEPDRIMVVPDAQMIVDLMMAGYPPSRKWLDGTVRVNLNWNQPGARLIVVGNSPTTGKPQPRMTPEHAAMQQAEKHGRISDLEANGVLTDMEKALREGAEGANPKKASVDAALLLAMITAARMGGRGESLEMDADGNMVPVQTFGITDIQARHVIFNPDGSATLRFPGKGNGIEEYEVHDPQALEHLRRYTQGKNADDPVFAVWNESKGEWDEVTYKRASYRRGKLSGDTDVKAHDFRTHTGTKTAKELISTMPVPRNHAELRKAKDRVAAAVGRRINDRADVALAYYIDPDVFAAWEEAIHGPDSPAAKTQDAHDFQGAPSAPTGPPDPGVVAPFLGDTSATFQGAPTALDHWNEKPTPAFPPVDYPPEGAETITTPDGRTFVIYPQQSESSYDDEVPRIMVVPDAQMIMELMLAGYPIPRSWERDTWRVNINWNQPGARMISMGENRRGKSQQKMTPEHEAAASESKHGRIRENRKALLDKLNDALRKGAQNPNDKKAAVDAALLLAQLTAARIGTGRGSSLVLDENGNEVEIETFGISEIQAKHVTLNPDGTATVTFPAKGGKMHTYQVTDPDGVAALQRFTQGKGPDDPVFAAWNDRTGKWDDVTQRRADYRLSALTGDSEFKAHDFRTAVATQTAQEVVAAMGVPKTEAQLKKFMKDVAKIVGDRINDTPSVAMKSYIDPEIFADWYEAIYGDRTVRLAEPASPKERILLSRRTIKVTSLRPAATAPREKV